MPSKLRFYSAGMILALGVNSVQADKPIHATNVSPMLSHQLAQISTPAPRSSSHGSFSLNQNKRLQLGEGLSYDSTIANFQLSENTTLLGLSRLNNEEQHFAVGVQFGDNLLSVMTGRGEGFSRLSNQYAYLDPYYFHGGTTAEYQFNNVEWQHQLNKGVRLQFGQASIDAEQVERRDTQYIGANIGKFSTHYMQVHRTQDKVGEALSLSYNASIGQLDWSALRQQAGGLAHQFTFDLNSSSPNQFGFSVGSQRNPLIEEDNQVRVMFRFSRSLKAHHRVNAGEESDSPRLKINRYAILGGAAVAAGLALSSGSDSQDTNLRLPDQHEAARRAVNEINPTSVRENREYGGWVYRTPDDRYVATDPVKGELASVSIPLSLIPPGGERLASYHTHGANDPNFVNEQFSPTDIASAESFDVDGYLGTPGAKFLWYDHRNNTITLLGSVATQ